MSYIGKITAINVLVLLSISTLTSQKLYCGYSGRTLGASEIYSITVWNCQQDTVTRNVNGYCFAYDGVAIGHNVGIAFDSKKTAYAMNNTFISFISIFDTLTGCEKKIISFPYNFNSPIKWNNLDADNCDVLYTTSRDSLKSFDLKTMKWKHHGTTSPYNFVNTTWRDGNLYGMYRNSIYRINIIDPSQSVEVFKFDTGSIYPHDTLVCMTSLETSCGNWVTYVLSEDVGHPSIPHGMSTLDFNTGKFTFLCRFAKNYFWGIAARPLDLNCPFDLDLDSNNSSGSFGYDFQNTGCPQRIEICDLDINFKDNGEIIDSVTFEIKGILDTNFEKLILNTCSFSSFVQRSDSQFTLINRSLSNTELMQCIRQIYYCNTKDCPTLGFRDIEIIAHSCIKKSKLAVSHIDVPRLSCAGDDLEKIVCRSESEFSINSLLSTNSTNDGVWYPDSLLINPKNHLEGQKTYLYIVKQDTCGYDTAFIKVRFGGLNYGFLGNDTSICNLTNFRIDPKQTGMHTWNDGSHNTYLDITMSGVYIVNIIDSMNCISKDTIAINNNQNYVENSTVSKCNNDIYLWRGKLIANAGLYSDTVKQNNGCDSIFFLEIINENLNTVIKSFMVCPDSSFSYKSKFYKSGDVIRDTISSIVTCDTIVEIRINEYPVEQIMFNTDSIICKDELVNLSASTNFQSYKWSTGEDKSSIQVSSGTYTLTVTDVNGCNVNSSITIKESPTIQYNAIPIDPICPEDRGSIEITNLQGGTAPLEYYLNGKKVSLSALDYLNSGLYIFKAIDSENCEVSDTIRILDAAIFDVVFDDHIELEEGTNHSLTFPNQNPKIASIQVSPNSDVVIQNGIELKFSPKEDITYTLTFTDERGCELIKTITFTIKRNEGFYAPTAFSPNGDNINDVWQPIYGNVYTLVSATIFDRWGEQVYYTNNPSVEWNGTYKSQQCNPGVYVYLIELRHRDGSVKKFSGDVSLIR